MPAEQYGFYFAVFTGMSYGASLYLQSKLWLYAAHEPDPVKAVGVEPLTMLLTLCTCPSGNRVCMSSQLPCTSHFCWSAHKSTYSKCTLTLTRSSNSTACTSKLCNTQHCASSWAYCQWLTAEGVETVGICHSRPNRRSSIACQALACTWHNGSSVHTISLACLHFQQAPKQGLKEFVSET
jgi:hypothetical protein